MKKVTLFFAALAVAFSVNAQWFSNPGLAGGENYTFWYDVNANAWVTDRMPDVDELFTFAIELKNQAFIDYNNTAPDGTATERAVGVHVWGDARPGLVNGLGEPITVVATDIRLRRIEGDIWGCDMVLSQMLPDLVALDNGYYNLRGQFFPAQIGDATPWFDSALGGVLEIAEPPMQWSIQEGVHTSTDVLPGDGGAFPAGTASPGEFTGTGLKEIAADPECGEPIGLFNMLGQSVNPNSDAKGVFIATYKGCPSKKILVK